MLSQEVKNKTKTFAKSLHTLETIERLIHSKEITISNGKHKITVKNDEEILCLTNILRNKTLEIKKEINKILDSQITENL